MSHNLGLRIFSAFVGILILLIAAMAALPLVSFDRFKGQINDALTSAIGRPVAINGSIRLQIIPSPAISVGSVEIANPPSASEPLLVSIGQLKLQAALPPLLDGQLHIRSIRLNDPQVWLEVDSTGQPNWIFETPQTTDQSASATTGSGFELDRLGIDDFRINNGQLQFVDQRSGFKQALDGLNATASLDRIAQVLTAKGSLIWQGLPLDFDGEVDPLANLVAGKQVALRATLTSSTALNGAVEGRMTLAPNFSFEGPFRFRSDTLPGLAQRVGIEIPQADELAGPLSAEGQLIVVGEAFAITDAILSADLPSLTANFDGQIGYQQGQPQIGGAGRIEVKNAQSLVQAAKAYLPEVPALNGTAVADGTVLVVGQDFDLSGIALDADLNIGTAQARLNVQKRGEFLASNGQADIALTRLGVLTQLLEPLIPQISQIDGSLTATGAYELNGPDISLKDTNLTADTSLGKVAFEGSGSWIGTKPQAEGRFQVSIPDLKPVAIIASNFVPQTSGLTGSALAKAQMSYLDEQNFEFNGIEFALDTNLGQASFKGGVQNLRGNAEAQGFYDAETEDIQALLALAPMPIEGLEALNGRLDLNGALTSDGKLIRSEQIKLNAQTTLGSLRAEGIAWFDQALGYDFQIEADVPSLDQVLAIAAPGTSTGLPDSRLSYQGGLAGQGQIVQVKQAVISVANPLVSASYTGFIQMLGTQIEADGRLAARGKSLRSLTDVFELTLPGQSEAFGAFDLKSDLIANGKALEISNTQLTLDNQTMALAATIDLQSSIPQAQIAINASALKLDPYLFDTTTTPVAQTQEAGWNKDPIDWSGLNAINASIALQSQALELMGYKLDQARIDAQLNEGQLEAILSDIQAYDGQGSGKIILNARSAEPSISAQLDMRGVNVKPLYQASVGRDDVEGLGSLNFDVLSWGLSQANLMSNLKGTAAINLADGAVKGFDLTETISSLKQQEINPAIGDSQQTQFDTLRSEAVIDQGILTTQGFELASDTLQLGGRGQVNLGQRWLDYRFEPRLNQTFATARGLNPALTQFTLPVLVRGPWANPDIRTDLSGILDLARSDPGALLALVPEGALKDLLPSDFDIRGLAALQTQNLQAKAQAKAQALADQAAQRAEEAAARVREEIEQRAEQRRKEFERLAEQELKNAQEAVGNRVDQAVGDILNGLF